MIPVQTTVNVPKQVLTAEPVISISNLNHYFGEGNLRKQALFDINLNIDAGKIVIMMGPSGAGKTTLLTLRVAYVLLKKAV